jgi:hypothetical protein
LPSGHGMLTNHKQLKIQAYPTRECQVGLQAAAKSLLDLPQNPPKLADFHPISCIAPPRGVAGLMAEAVLPMRVVIHLDLDCFYAQVRWKEQQRVRRAAVFLLCHHPTEPSRGPISSLFSIAYLISSRWRSSGSRR